MNETWFEGCIIILRFPFLLAKQESPLCDVYCHYYWL